ncbi:MAG: hypothetical protein GY759_07615 [Chloroflexi bacterium]|nr:hypothetical protein [Chloroflexota bacterium]
MALDGDKIYVGFGFGAIQTGLFLYEALNSANFGRLVVAEILADVVDMVRTAGGHFTVNIAHADRIEGVDIGPVEIENPAIDTDRERLITAIAAAHEIGTAIPSVDYYESAGPGSLHAVLAEGLRQKMRLDGPPAVVYAAENNNHAAEILEAKVFSAIPADERSQIKERVRFLNTVIGKMSGIVTDRAEIESQGLAATTPQADRAYLVEAFNRILISEIDFGDQRAFQRGIEVFAEKKNLLPFEEAKLYGHNATHALAAYLGAMVGVENISELRSVPGMIPFMRDAFVGESGAALIQKYGDVDALFTVQGYRHYADDLLERMTNPFLHDTVERVGRDPRRKLGWRDRLVGTMRVAIAQDIAPERYAFGTAAALALLEPAVLTADIQLAPLLDSIWNKTPNDRVERMRVESLLAQAVERLRTWNGAGLPDLSLFWADVF